MSGFAPKVVSAFAWEKAVGKLGVDYLDLLIKPDLAIYADIDGHTAGMAIAIPNLNEIHRRIIDEFAALPLPPSEALLAGKAGPNQSERAAPAPDGNELAGADVVPLVQKGGDLGHHFLNLVLAADADDEAPAVSRRAMDSEGRHRRCGCDRL